MADSFTADSGATPGAQPGPPIDTSKSELRYVNFCHVTSTAEDLTIDLGLQTPAGAAQDVWESPQRVTLSFFTAKRLAQTLALTLEQFEKTFGTIETNVEKRLRNER